MGKRKGFDSLSAAYQQRVIRALSPDNRDPVEAKRFYEQGASLRPARGHKTTPDSEADWNRNPDIYRSYSLRRGKVIHIMTAQGNITVEGLSPQELSTIGTIQNYRDKVVKGEWNTAKYERMIKGKQTVFTGYVNRDRSDKDPQLSVFALDTNPDRIRAIAHNTGKSYVSIYPSTGSAVAA